MSQASLLAKLGVLTVPDFLAPTECERIIAEMRAGEASVALVSMGGADTEQADERWRRTDRVRVHRRTEAELLGRLRETRARMEEFFDLRLSPVLETPKFLRYRPGDFFVAHRDARTPSDETTAPIIRARLVNLIVSLNDERSASSDRGYVGAGLTLYGLIDEPQWRRYGFPVRVPTGTLVAFRSSVVHEVAPVVSGTRYSVVSRMLDPTVRLEPAGSPAGTPR